MNHQSTPFLGAIAIMSLTAACSGDVSLGKNDSKVSPGGGSGGASATDPGSGGSGGASCGTGGTESWLDLVQAEWTVAPAEENTICVRKTLTEDVNMGAVRSTNAPGAIAPPTCANQPDGTLCSMAGVHDTMVSAGAPNGPDGTTNCYDPHAQPPVGALFGTNSESGTQELTVPDGFALKVAAGQQLLLQVHVINTSDHPVTGVSTNQFLAATGTGLGSMVEPVVGLDGVGVDQVAAAGPPPCDDAPWTHEITGDWSLPAGDEQYLCVRQTLTSDLNYQVNEVTNALGTLDAVVSVGAPSGPDGSTTCDASTRAAQVLSVSGAGTERLRLPTGFAGSVQAGQQLLLNIHLVNTTDKQMTGQSASRFH